MQATTDGVPAPTDHSPITPRQRGSCRAVFAAGAMLVLLAGLAACGGSHGAEPKRAPRPAVKVSVLSPTFVELPRFVRATGTLHGDEETTIAAKVSGRVVEISRDLGDTAAPGEPLLRVDPTDYQLALDERKQAYREVLASIGLAEFPNEDFSIDSLPAVERAHLQAENARARYERGKVLAERQPPLISEQEFADLKTTWDVAGSNLRVERLGAEATLAEARTLQAQVRLAEQRVEDSVHLAPAAPVRASGSGDDPGSPASGERRYEVAARLVSVGDFVQIGTPLFRLVDSNPLKLRAFIPERRVGVVKAGQSVLVKVESSEQMFKGVVRRVSPAVDVLTRNFMVEILVPNENRELKPGSFAVAEIHVATERALVVPEEAVVTFAGVHKVVAVTDSKAEEKRVELGQRHEGMVEIVKGATPEDVLVAKPPGSLTTGAPVVVAPESRAAVDAGGEPLP